jgi:hypothetical protein
MGDGAARLGGGSRSPRREAVGEGVGGPDWPADARRAEMLRGRDLLATGHRRWSIRGEVSSGKARGCGDVGARPPAGWSASGRQWEVGRDREVEEDVAMWGVVGSEGGVVRLCFVFFSVFTHEACSYRWVGCRFLIYNQF